jgi:metal-responsive CopG/Arc/MetJ family transcriptional regulator
MIDSGGYAVPAKKQGVTSNSAPRASITFPPELYGMLEAIARSKKVSVAWVVRDAAEKYVAEQWPLLEKP